MLGLFDRINPLWDLWDRWKEKFPAIVIIEFVYFGAILYYIVYWELSGTT